ncbi:MAG: hypothetical protein U0350_15445 [Caldilineaceae bacterium]
MKIKQILSLILLFCLLLEPTLPPASPTRANAAPQTDPRVTEVMQRVNAKWRRNHPDPGDNQWGRAVYHIGNLAHYATTGDAPALAYTQRWAEQNQ